MPYDQHLLERVEKVLKDKNVKSIQKNMIGGLCFMVNDKMCVGIVKNELMARVDPGIYDKIVGKKGSHEMDFTGRPMRGFVFVSPQGIDLDKDLEYWIDLCLTYNPKAKASKKK